MAAGWRRLPRRVRFPIVGVLLLLVAVALLDVLIDGPLRRIIERRMNERLQGYTVTLEAVDFSPWNLSLDLFGLTLAQDAHPRPPVAHIPRFNFNVQWRSLLVGRVVADTLLRGPRLHLNLAQLREERRDEMDVEDRGWQAALLAAYPLQINELKVEAGAATYTHGGDARPLELSAIGLLAANLRNVRSPERTYPSAVHFESRVFERGRAVIDGQADFLAEPHPGIAAGFTLEEIPLARLDPVSRDVHLRLAGGLLSARGEIEFAPKVRQAHLAEVLIAGLELDYLFDPELTERALDAAKEASRDPRLTYRLDRLRLDDGELGFVNRGTDPGYRLFVSGTDLTLAGVGNGPRAGPAKLRGQGRFMGSGRTAVTANLRPDREGADFDLNIAIQGTELRAMNDFLRAYSNLDVTEGVFSFYSELAARDGKLDGYIKPHFEDVEIYDSEQEKHDGFFRRVWEGIAEGLSELLEDRPEEEVATIADLSGSLEDPEASNLQVIANLIRNAFFESILPGFRKETEE